MSPRRRRTLTTLARIAGSVLGFLLLSGSSCTVHYSGCTHHGHEHDHHDACHHHHHDATHAAELDRAYAAVVAAGDAAFRLRSYDAVLEAHPGGWHVRGLNRIDGPALAALAPGYAPTPKALRALAERTIANNAAVIGLARGIELRFVGFGGWYGGQSTRFDVEATHEPPLVLRFDRAGTLMAIERPSPSGL